MTSPPWWREVMAYYDASIFNMQNSQKNKTKDDLSLLQLKISKTVYTEYCWFQYYIISHHYS